MTTERRHDPVARNLVSRRVPSPSVEIERQARLKRLMLVGVFAAFLSIFGALVADGYLLALSDDPSSPIILRVDDDGERTAASPQVRTRSS